MSFGSLFLFGFFSALVSVGLALTADLSAETIANTLLSAVCGTALAAVSAGLCFRFKQHFFPDRLRNEKALRKLLPGVPVLAEIARCENKLPDFYLLDAESQTRAQLQALSQKLPACTLLLGGKMGSGSSFFAANIALFLSQHRRTLLVDLGLMDSTLARSFAMPSAPGMADILKDEASLDKSIVNAVEGSLWFLPAGTRQNHFNVLDAGKLKRIFNELRHRFDVVLIDAPVELSPLLQQLEVEYVLVVPNTMRADSLPPAIKAKAPLGVVLNCVE